VINFLKNMTLINRKNKEQYLLIVAFLYTSLNAMNKTGAVTYKLLLVATLISSMFFLKACGGSKDNEADNVKQGRFLDSPVEGLSYISGRELGVTDSQGTFTYEEGENIQFSIGDIIIGDGIPKSMMTPVDLVLDSPDETNPTVTNITRFLITLDNDGNPNNGISITDNMRYAAAGRSINFEQEIIKFENDTNVQTIVSELLALVSTTTRVLISVQAAQTHLRNTMSDIDDDQDSFTENEGDCNDNDAAIYPGAQEILSDGIDQDCDGRDDNGDWCNLGANISEDCVDCLCYSFTVPSEWPPGTSGGIHGFLNLKCSIDGKLICEYVSGQGWQSVP